MHRFATQLYYILGDQLNLRLNSSHIILLNLSAAVVNDWIVLRSRVYSTISTIVKNIILGACRGRASQQKRLMSRDLAAKISKL